FARRVAGALGDEQVGRGTLVLVALNPFILALAGTFLSDLVSAALITVAVALLLPTRGVVPTKDVQPARGAVVRDGMVALFVLAFAAEGRPANAVLLPVGAAIWLLRWRAVAWGDGWVFFSRAVAWEDRRL